MDVGWFFFLLLFGWKESDCWHSGGITIAIIIIRWSVVVMLRKCKHCVCVQSTAMERASSAWTHRRKECLMTTHNTLGQSHHIVCWNSFLISSSPLCGNSITSSSSSIHSNESWRQRQLSRLTCTLRSFDIGTCLKVENHPSVLGATFNLWYWILAFAMATVISERELSWFEVELHNKRANEVGEDEMKKKSFSNYMKLFTKLDEQPGLRAHGKYIWERRVQNEILINVLQLSFQCFFPLSLENFFFLCSAAIFFPRKK